MNRKVTVALIALMFHPIFAFAVPYDCTTEFGEAVPLRFTTYKNGDVASSVEWNEAVRKDKSLTSQIKAIEYGANPEKSVYEWRYAKKAGSSFKIDVRCPADGKCSGSFLESSDPAALDLETSLFDQRFPVRRGYVQLRLGSREELAFRVRVFKEMGASAESKQVFSGSGEHMILSLQPKFILDVGVDEHLKLSKEFTHRVAALEIKIRCSLPRSDDR